MRRAAVDWLDAGNAAFRRGSPRFAVLLARAVVGLIAAGANDEQGCWLSVPDWPTSRWHQSAALVRNRERARRARHRLYAGAVALATLGLAVALAARAAALVRRLGWRRWAVLAQAVLAEDRALSCPPRCRRRTPAWRSLPVPDGMLALATSPAWRGGTGPAGSSRCFGGPPPPARLTCRFCSAR
jgi:hypothetical protein